MVKGKNSKKVLPVPTIRRFPLYLSFLKSARNKELEIISGREIAEKLQIDPTQITKDFSHINITGKTRIGYNVETLISTIEHFLGYQILRKAYIVGIGNLGQALIHYNEFETEGLAIIAGFEIDKNIIGTVINDVQIFNLSDFQKVFKKTPVDIGIITVPASQAQNVASLMIDCGIKAIWNFSTLPISAPENIIVENTTFESSLAMIKWKLHQNKPLIYKNRII